MAWVEHSARRAIWGRAKKVCRAREGDRPMKRLGIRKLRKFLRRERGQAAVIAVLTATTIMSLAGAALETGHIYYAYDLLQASTNAAALAAANAIPNTTQ